MSHHRLDQLRGQSYLMTDEGYAYILPAYMRASLQGPTEARFIDNIIRTYYQVSGPKRSPHPLNPDQMAVFCDWFEWALAGVEKDWQEYALETQDTNCLAEAEESLAEMRALLVRWRSKAQF